MYQINNEKFGLFLSQIRKEKNLTQKELGEQLFVSDKTVSKWERGLSLPNVVLLIPLADTLGISVTELLRGEKTGADKKLDAKEVEGLVVDSLDLSVRSSLKQHKRNWILAFLLCFFITVSEIIVLYLSGMSFYEMSDTVLLLSGLMLFFGGWFCFFARDLLPVYFDENKINYYSQGIVRMHLPGLSFNNGNWGYICSTLKGWTLSVSVLYPLACFITVTFISKELWNSLEIVLFLAALFGMFIHTYIIGKKYE